MLIAFDRQLFLWLNHLPHNAVFNWLALFIANFTIWFWLGLGVLFFVKEKKKKYHFAGSLILAGVASAILSNFVFKLLFARLRPSVEIGAIIIQSDLDSFSFPSGHATFSFAMATVLSTIAPKWRWLLYSLAIVISFTRIYLGVHYPLDVIGGGLLGILTGWLSLMPGNFERQKRIQRLPDRSKRIQSR